MGWMSETMPSEGLEPSWQLERESAAKKNKPARRPPAGAVGVDKGAHITVETVYAFTVLAHNRHIYWGKLRGSRVHIYSLPRASSPGPRQGESCIPEPGTDQLFP